MSRADDDARQWKFSCQRQEKHLCKRDISVTQWRPELDTTGTITSFSAAKGAYFNIGGDSYSLLTALKSYSLTNPDPQTLQFEIQPGDAGWNDLQTGEKADRSEAVQSPELINQGTPIAIDYQFMVQPNGPNNTFTNTASWFVTGEMQGTEGAGSPPFAIQLSGDHLQVVARYVQPGGNPANGSPDLHMLTLWTDPNPIVPGQYNDINIQADVSNSGGGYLKVSINGNQVVNYQGPLGYGGANYWLDGLYRNQGPTQTVTADFRNMTLVTGSQAAGWKGVGGSSGGTSSGTTPSGGTTPTTPVSTNPGSGGGATAPTTPTTPVSTSPGSSGGATAPTTPTTPVSTSPGSSGGATAPTTPTTPVSTSPGSSGGATAPTTPATPVSTSPGSSGGATAPTTPTTPVSTSPGSSGGATAPTTPVAPKLTVADQTLSVSPGGKVSLGIDVSVPHAGDNVSVNISGLAKYETITDNLDHKTFSGSSITLTAAEVNSGLSLSSSYHGHGQPTATLTVTAHDATGTPVTSAAQTITVKDPPSATASAGTSTTTSGGGTSSGQSHHWWSDHHHQAVAATSSGTSTTTSGQSSGQSQASHSNVAQWFNDHPDFAHVATTLSEAGASRSGAVPNVATTTTNSPASAGARSFALLNQMMAGDFNGASHFAQATTASSASSQQQANLLTRPLH
jgi:hypothetical protein